MHLALLEGCPEGRAFGHGYTENTGVDGVELGDDISQSRATAGLRKKVRVLATGCTRTVARPRARARLRQDTVDDDSSLAATGEKQGKQRAVGDGMRVLRGVCGSCRRKCKQGAAVCMELELLRHGDTRRGSEQAGCACEQVSGRAPRKKLRRPKATEEGRD